MLSRWIYQVIFIVVLSLAGCGSGQVTDSELVAVELVRVVSGQTIEVNLGNKPQRVRLIGIDVPSFEDDTEAYKAKTHLEQLLNSKQLQLEIPSPKRDRYNRLLAHLWQEERLISEELAQAGYVVANQKYPHKYQHRLLHAQEYARVLGYGIWQE